MNLSEQARAILRRLLADLFDDHDSQLLSMKDDFITSELLPVCWEKNVLQAFELADTKDVIPTPENIARLMLTNRDELPDLLELRQLATHPRMILANAIWIKSYLQQEKLTRAVNEITKLGKMDYADAREKQAMMLDELISVPLEDARATYNRLSLIENFQEVQAERVRRRHLKQALGGILPLKGLQDLVPVLAPGDVTLITAPPKSGKTSVAMVIAEVNTVYNDADVLWLLLETSPETIEERFLSKELLIPGKALRNGSVDLTKKPFKERHDVYKEKQKALWESKGHLHLHYVAGGKLSEIRSLVRIHKRLADQRNRPLLVLVDYLQRIPKPGNKTDVEAIAHISNGIKDMAVNYNCHIILFSQESFSTEGKLIGDSRAHGSNTPIFIAQIHIAIRVLNALRSYTVNHPGGEPKLDALGNQRYWQREGNHSRQSVLRFDVLRANNDDTGEAFGAFENGLFRMVDLSDPAQTIPEFMKSDMTNFAEDMKLVSRRLA